MKDPNLINFEDFEIIDAPSSTPSPEVPTPSTELDDLIDTEQAETNRPNTDPPNAEPSEITQSRSAEPEAASPTHPGIHPSIKSLFEKPRKQTDIGLYVARILVALSLPFALTCTTFVTVLRSLRKDASNEQLLSSVSKSVVSAVDEYRERLVWVDEELVGWLEASKPDIRKTLHNIKAALKQFFANDRYVPIIIFLVRGFWPFVVYAALAMAFPHQRRKVRVLFILQGLLGLLPVWIFTWYGVKTGRYRALSHVRGCGGVKVERWSAGRGRRWMK